MKSAIAQLGIGLRASVLICAVAVLAWGFVVWSTANMDDSLVMLMRPVTGAWNWVVVLAVFTMWSAMMAAMMLPAALPVLVALGRMTASEKGKAARGSAAYFGAGHLLIWMGFAAAATAAQWALIASSKIEPMTIKFSHPVVGGAVLIAAGLFQWTPLKETCLSRCRAPLGFLLTAWRPGRTGAVVMGLHYGLYCVGCCWALMALLFVSGAMNLLAIGALALLVLFEKLVPAGELVAKAIGAGLIALGIWWIASA